MQSERTIIHLTNKSHFFRAASLRLIIVHLIRDCIRNVCVTTFIHCSFLLPVVVPNLHNVSLYSNVADARHFPYLRASVCVRVCMCLNVMLVSTCKTIEIQ